MYVNDTRNPLSRHQICVEGRALWAADRDAFICLNAKGYDALIASPLVSAYNQHCFRSASPLYTLTVLLCI